ncbi:MAG: sulfotransferase [Crocinitomicaceae bacterium]|nr:sulfotransferase [Crocinitomicaceae bacterium]
MKTERFFKPHILIGSNWFNFFRWTASLNFSITSEGFFRLMLSSLILFMLTPFRIIETVVYFFTKKEEVKQPIFIIGHPRSGTTFFHDSLNELEDLVAPRMLDCLFPYLNKHFKFLLIPILEKALPKTRLIDKMKVRWDSPQEEEFGMALMSPYSSVAFLFAPKRSAKILNDIVLLNDSQAKAKWQVAHQRYARKIQTMNKGKTLVFKSPGNTARIEELLEIYPDAKFIHFVRNPQAVIPSALHLYQSILPEFSLQNISKFDLSEYVFEYYERVMNKYLSSKDKLSQEQLFELKYEDFVEAPMENLENAFAQLNIPSSPDSLKEFFDSRKKFSKNKYGNNPDLTKQISERCAEMISHYNYS